MTTVSVTTHLLDTHHKPPVLSQQHNILGHKDEVYCFLQDTRVLLDIFLQCLCNVDLEHSRLHQTCNRNLNYMERKISGFRLVTTIWTRKHGTLALLNLELYKTTKLKVCPKEHKQRALQTPTSNQSLDFNSLKLIPIQKYGINSISYGSVVRAMACHQCGLGSIPVSTSSVRGVCWFSTLL